MNGARFVHDTLEQEGWEVEIADAQKVKGRAPLACSPGLDAPRPPAVLGALDPGGAHQPPHPVAADALAGASDVKALLLIPEVSGGTWG